MADIRSSQVTVTRNTGGVLVLALDGEIDADTRPAVSAALHDAVTGSPESDVVVVDLSAVVFFAAAGLHLVVDLAEECRRRGLPVRLVVTSGSTVARVVGIAGLAEFIPTFGTVAQALRARAA